MEAADGNCNPPIQGFQALRVVLRHAADSILATPLLAKKGWRRATRAPFAARRTLRPSRPTHAADFMIGLFQELAKAQFIKYRDAQFLRSLLL